MTRIQTADQIIFHVAADSSLRTTFAGHPDAVLMFTSVDLQKPAESEFSVFLDFKKDMKNESKAERIELVHFKENEDHKDCEFGIFKEMGGMIVNKGKDRVKVTAVFESIFEDPDKQEFEFELDNEEEEKNE